MIGKGFGRRAALRHKHQQESGCKAAAIREDGDQGVGESEHHLPDRPQVHRSTDPPIADRHSVRIRNSTATRQPMSPNTAPAGHSRIVAALCVPSRWVSATVREGLSVGTSRDSLTVPHVGADYDAR